MGVYVVTGGSRGIGAKTVGLLKKDGHTVVNIDISDGDINVDLAADEGRNAAIKYVYDLFPSGIDGFVCNHGIGGLARYKSSYILSVNYFSAVTLLDSFYELLKKKSGNCVVVSSGSIAYAKRKKYFVDELLTNCGDEKRICRLVDSFAESDTKSALQQTEGARFIPGEVANAMYISSKMALAHRVRRISSSWAQHGVNINAIAPGAAATSIMQGMKKPPLDVFFYPMPAIPDQEGEMDPDDIARVIAFLVSPENKGMSGALVYCDAGASAIIDPDKY